MKSPEDITRFSRHLEYGTGRAVMIRERSYLFFGGTAYLGLNQHPGFTALFREGLQRYGLNNGTSRTNNVQLGIYDAAEQHAAEKFGFEQAILLSSGYLAAQLAVRQISNNYSPDQILYSPCSHPALWLNGKPTVNRETSGGKPSGNSFPSESFQEWALATVQQINNSTEDSFLLISNTLDNVQPQRFDFSVFDAIGPDKKVHFILDDSHGLGIFHPSRTSVQWHSQEEFLKQFQEQSKQLQEQPQHTSPHPGFKLTVVASLAKGSGIDAGIILSDQQTIQELRRTGVFVGASPSAPAFLYAFLKGDGIYQEQWEKLNTNIRFFEKHLPELKKWVYIPDYPVFYRPGMQYFDKLAEKEILISSFPYPDPADQPLDRIVVSAAHTREDLEKLISCLK